MNPLLRCIYIAGITLIAFLVIYGFSVFIHFESVLMAIEINFIMMAWITVVFKLCGFQWNWNYFLPKKFEKNGVMYKWLGVLWFNWLLTVSGWNRLIMKEVNFTKSIEGVIRLELHTRFGEFSHLIIFFIIVVVSLPILIGGNVEIFLWYLGLNIFFNLYPVMLQRMKRIRILNILYAKGIDPYS